MFWKKKEQKSIPWEELSEEAQLETINELSKTKPVLIFKHSTRCSISAMAKNRFEKGWEEANVSIWLLDLIRYREISNKIAADYGVMHQSPQVLLIKNGECIYTATHNAIDFKSIQEAL